MNDDIDNHNENKIYLSTAVFIIQFVDAGIMRAFGVLFVAIQMTYGASASTIGVIGLVEAATFSITCTCI